MKIIVIDTQNNQKEIGDSNSLPIPRIGESINLGYAPLPTVTNVAYLFETNVVAVYVDGFILNR